MGALSRVMLVAFAACGFTHGSAGPRDAPPGPGDDATDAPVSTGDGPATDTKPADAPVACVQARCAAAGGTCMADACLIDHNGPTAVTCPAGMPCKVICEGSDDCKAGVDCGDATTCEVTCDGAAACQDDGVDCGTATTCTVRCIGPSACQQGMSSNAAVECRKSICTVTCSGDAACQNGIDVEPGGTCTSHCCGTSACQDGFDTCMNDAICN